MDFWTLPKVSAPYLWDKAPSKSRGHCPPPPGMGPCSCQHPRKAFPSPSVPQPCSMAQGRPSPPPSCLCSRKRSEV